MRTCFRMALGSCLALVMLCTLVACNGEVLPPVDEIVDGFLEAQENITTCRQEINMDMNMKITSGGQSGRIVISMRADGDMNFPDREMRMDMNMTMSISAAGQSERIEGDILMYVIDDAEYTKIDMPGEYSGWQKSILSAFELEQTWSEASYTSALADLLEGSDATVKKVQNIGGVPCYLLEVRPSTSALADFIEQQQLGDVADLGFDFSEMFRSFTIRYWIAKDSYDIMKGIIDATLYMEEAGDKLEGSMTLELNARDYGVPVSIELPAAALMAD